MKIIKTTTQLSKLIVTGAKQSLEIAHRVLRASPHTRPQAPQANAVPPDTHRRVGHALSLSKDSQSHHEHPMSLQQQHCNVRLSFAKHNHDSPITCYALANELHRVWPDIVGEWLGVDELQQIGTLKTVILDYSSSQTTKNLLILKKS